MKNRHLESSRRNHANLFTAKKSDLFVVGNLAEKVYHANKVGLIFQTTLYWAGLTLVKFLVRKFQDTAFDPNRIDFLRNVFVRLVDKFPICYWWNPQLKPNEERWRIHGIYHE